MSRSHKWLPHFPEASTETHGAGIATGDQGDSQPEGNTDRSAITTSHTTTNITHAVTHTTNLTTLSEGHAPHVPFPASQADESTTGRPGRRSKTHTLTACNNCKRAHLGCDVARPCSRCVLSGKQDTCADVPQKKRGRPRLRADSSTGSRMSRDDTTLPTATIEDLTTRYHAAEQHTRSAGHTRADSMRSLQSTEGSASSTAHVSPISSRDHIDPFSRMLGPARSQQPVVPTAWLDLDLNIIKADDSFTRIFGNYQGVVGRRLAEIGLPSTPDLFQALRTKMRDERESKDPAYLPPIAIPGEDPLGPMANINVAEATRGFDPLHYMLSYTFASGMQQTLATKFNLARTSRYFIIMSLPPLTPDFFAVVVGQATRAQEASVPPVTNSRTPFQIMTMFSDSRVANVLSTGASSPSDSPVDDLDIDLPDPRKSKDTQAQASSSTVDEKNPALHTPQISLARQGVSARPGPLPSDKGKANEPSSAGPSSVSTPHSIADLEIYRIASNESAMFSDDEGGPASRPKPTLHDLLNRQSQPHVPVDWRPPSSGNTSIPSRRASQQGGPRESDKKRRMDISSLLHQ
ncbi:hypothetical protein BDZ85DRAFT_57123 [Elsinoe ampelina]|uniref:Zn(2)-C6 fungal-type domain-containing protein n=1 Tax=Elsinoe ampelina TaxID=302913 RepID=A0A6A6GMK8_9PEZI|nr:hypothetical protein BDZ85DRAFT_57123 [Elsinoe ampelina]